MHVFSSKNKDVLESPMIFQGFSCCLKSRWQFSDNYCLTLCFFLHVSPQPKGFRRYYSSPLLIQEQYGCIKEVMPIGNRNRFSPVGTLYSSDSQHLFAVNGNHVSALLRSLR